METILAPSLAETAFSDHIPSCGSTEFGVIPPGLAIASEGHTMPQKSKKLDAVGIEPTTFHKYASSAEDCEAKIIPLDQAPQICDPK